MNENGWSQIKCYYLEYVNKRDIPIPCPANSNSNPKSGIDFCGITYFARISNFPEIQSDNRIDSKFIQLPLDWRNPVGFLATESYSDL